MLMDFEHKLDGLVETYASAAIGIPPRQGLGKTRHIDVQYLWIQNAVKNKELSISKVPTELNPADLMTKGLKEELIYRHLKFMNFKVDNTRAKTAPKLQAVVGPSDSWEKLNEQARRRGNWIRRHDKPRGALFTPMKIAGGPTQASRVASQRITIGVYANGEKFHLVDDWKCAAEPHRRMPRPWTGTTIFASEREILY